MASLYIPTNVQQRFANISPPCSQTVIRRREAGMCDCVRAHKERRIMGKECMPVLEELHGAWTQTATHKKAGTQIRLWARTRSPSPPLAFFLSSCADLLESAVDVGRLPLSEEARTVPSLHSLYVLPLSQSVAGVNTDDLTSSVEKKIPASFRASPPTSDQHSYTHAKTHTQTLDRTS